MKKCYFLSLFLFVLSSCTGWENIGWPETQPKQTTQNNARPQQSLPPSSQVVSAEVDYKPQKNLINLTLEESEKIVARLLKKQKEEMRKYENTGSLVQWDWRAVYIPPKYPDGYDSITVTMAGKVYTLPGVYGEKQRNAYLDKIKEAKNRPESSCNDSKNYPDSVVIDNKYYRPPTSGDCPGTMDFRSIDSLSPSGKYLIYSELSMGWGASYIIDIQSGKVQLRTDFMSLIQWISDDWLIYYTPQSGGQPEQYGLFITRKWVFSEKQKIADDRRAVSLSVDDSYVYLLEEDMDYTLRIFDRANYKEVYTRIVKT